MQNTIKIFLALIALIIVTEAKAQREIDQRTLSTKIADILAELPAKDLEQYRENMHEIGAMGEEGLLALAEMLVDPEAGNNTKLEYALGGFSYYASQPGKEEFRQMSVEAYCQALEDIRNVENKTFIIRQLEMVGGEDAVSCLEGYLDEKPLCAPAARALVNINTFSSNKALLQALKNSAGECRLSLVQALADTKFGEAAAIITPLAKSGDDKLRKLSLYALANIADPASAEILQEAARNKNFAFGTDNATAAYLLFGQRLLEKGQKQQAEKVAETLLKGAKEESRLYSRTAALELLTDIHGEESVATLIEAAGDENPEFRAAALKFASDFITLATTKAWMKKARKSAAHIEAEIITMLGENEAKEAIPRMIKALRSRNDEVKLAAIGALGRIGDETVIPPFLKLMKKSNKQEIAAIKEAFFILDAKGLKDAVADGLPKMTAEGQAALLAVLGNRAASERIDDVFKYAQDKNEVVRIAALAALKSMATKEDLPSLLSLLNETSQPKEIRMLQEAIIAGIDDYENQSQQTALVLEEMQNTSEERRSRYFTILASIGGEQARNAVTEEFNKKGYPDTKAAAINALSSWSDVSAAEELFRISQDDGNSDYKNEALKGYVRTINQSEYPAVQKLLMLRKAFDGSAIQHRKLILQEVGGLASFHALTFAGKYLDEPLLQQEAARSVMRLALDNNYHGEVVRGLLNKTMEVLQGDGIEYLKQSILKFLEEMPKEESFVALFDGKDLSGWKGLVANPIERAKMNEKTLNEKQKIADKEMRQSWKVEDGALIFTGQGNNIATEKQYGDFELVLDWKIFDDRHKEGDAGIYLRGTPQVQMWDTSRVEVGAQVGSGGLYNNKNNPSKPLKVVDNPLGEWNHFRIIMKGDRVTVYLNGELVTDNVILENYWARSLPIFPEEQIELQAHGSRVAYRDIYIREIPRPEPFELSEAEKKEGFMVLFDGTNMHHWRGNTGDYVIEDGVMVVRKPKFGSGGNLYTREEFSDFVFRFEFKLTPGANNGLGIRTPLEGDAAYQGMELQILDNTSDIYKNLKEYQYHGSLYGIIPAKREYLNPVGEWNYQEVRVKGPSVKVILNGTTVVDGNMEEASKNGALDGKDHPGLKRDKGHIGFLGHGSTVWFRNIRVKDLKD